MTHATNEPAVRPAELAGTWYPGTSDQCQRSFDEFDRGRVAYEGARPLWGCVVPHAGWAFSGAIAHNAIGELASHAGAVETVILFAGHLSPRSVVTIMTHGEFWTPLGAIPVDEELAAKVTQGGHELRAESPDDHTQDNSFELQFPLIKHHFPNARLLAVGAPPTGETVAVADAILEASAELQRRVAFVGSTDLTHYGPNYGWAPMGTGEDAESWVREKNDRLFIDAALSMDVAAMIEMALAHRNACCPGAAAAAIHCSRALGSSEGTLLRYATSADIHRSSSFVGYAGIVF